MSETITTKEAARRVRESGGKLFGVTFIKRSTGSRRHLVGRIAPKGGWKTGTKGGSLKFNPADHDLLHVREFVTDPQTTRLGGDGKDRSQFVGNGNIGTQFRHVPIENIRELRIGGQRFTVED